MNATRIPLARSRPLGALVLAVALFLPVATVCSQDEATAAPTDAAAGDAAAAVAETVPAAPVAAPFGPTGQPKPAEMSPRAIRGLMLDIVYTGERLIAVGERGNIVASRDGIRWAQVSVPVRATLTGMSFVDGKQGWAVGHDATIIHTADGGQTWSVQAFNPGLLKPLHDVYFVDASHGYVFGSFGLFWETRDGGKTWMEVAAPAVLEEGYHLNGMTRTKDGQLLLVGESGLLAVSGDGTTWDRLESPYEGSFFGVVPRGEKGALAFGLRGNAYVTDDVRAGAWRKVNLATISSIFGAWVMVDGSIVLVGADAVVLTVLADETVERVATFAGVDSSGTINGVVRWPGGLMMVGESGVQPYQTKSAPTVRSVVTRELETTPEF
ncbi:MAG: WD40/YVTN/BNR-like repeat-containing protein [Panacagrimonas sp.]